VTVILNVLLLPPWLVEESAAAALSAFALPVCVSSNVVVMVMMGVGLQGLASKY
jgi:hypothetical protein